MNAQVVYQPTGYNMINGEAAHGQNVFSAAGNPAAAAAFHETQGDERTGGTGIWLGAGIEYGNVQDLFDAIDEVSKSIQPSPPDSGGSGGAPGQEPKPPDGIDIDVILDAIDPNLASVVDAVAVEAGTQAGLLAVIAAEGYAKTFLSADVPVIIGREMLGGSWTFGISSAGTSKAFGVVEPIEFDEDTALAELESVFDLQPGDPRTSYDLSGGLFLTLDPNTGSVKLALKNDSLLLTKSARVDEFAVGYSRRVWRGDSGSFFAGGTAKYYHMQLSRFSIRFGDITDSEELFKDIRNADFRADNGFGLDLGGLWVSDRYQLGASLLNVNEPSFEFNDIDTSNVTNPTIIKAIEDDQTYTMERQLKLEGSLFTEGRKYTVNLGADANPITDPMNDEFQWLTLSGGYNTGKWWLSNARLGYRRNLVGTELSYLGFGLTFLKYVNFDFASAFDTVKISGTELPQGLMLSLGAQFTW